MIAELPLIALHVSPARTDDGLSAFVAVRPRLFGIARRMLGSAFDAEDVVQDVWLRWQTTDRSVVRSVPAFLATMTTRLAINVVQSARSRRETFSEPLQEPADPNGDPGSEVERGEALERAVLLLIERLSPTERAAYVLGEAFDYPYARIAEVLHVSHANARQLASRARKHLAAEGRAGTSSAARRRLFDAFLLAAQTGELAALEQVLNADVVGTARPVSQMKRSPRRRVGTGSRANRDATACNAEVYGTDGAPRPGWSEGLWRAPGSRHSAPASRRQSARS